MEHYAVLGAVGAIALGTLAVLHLLVWRTERRDWSACFAAAHALGALVYAFDARLQPQAGRPNTVAAMAATAALLLLTFGTIDYVGMSRRAAARGRLIAVAA